MSLPTLLVTGGAGFIGTNFVRQLVTAGKHRIVNLDLLTYAGRRENVDDLPDHLHRFVRGDVGDKKLAQSLLDGSHSLYKQAGWEAPVWLIHFAAESHVDRSIEGPEAFVQTNLVGTHTLLEVARQVWDGDASRRFLHVSTDEVYGSLGPSGLFTEATPLAANSPYSASKAGADLLTRAYFETYHLPTLITRCSNNYGPYQLPEKLIPVVIDRILARQPIPIYGDGGNIRDWLYVSDHCDALMQVLAYGPVGEVFNIGGHNEWSNLDLVGLICDRLDAATGSKDSRSLMTFVEDRLGHDRRYAIDAGKMERELGWRPAETFETGITRTIDWYLEHHDWMARAKQALH